ncbi:YCF48-related protein [Alicyclobacillus dauci]|uniref:Photosynthesis system II assembly factor Ycf48/Hcf136-like domain-containing protein n=1 Tax=Alicyclobacillus dauci TaxID=1475485 RepID=A0ABY6Z101_9BACL|nr:hypothetical protein [Alicyclobacillus dauci]WAH36014.1 hypothetical protein NZD86_17385 [Alicyclobacillus dauci]
MRFLRGSLAGTVCLAMLSLSGCASTVTVPSVASSGQAKQSAASNSSAKPAPTGSSTSGSTTNGAVATFADTTHLHGAQLTMFDSRSGYAWGYYQSAFKLIHTTNAGKTWTNVSLPTLPKNPFESHGPGGSDFVECSFFDDSHGWLMWLAGDKAHIYFTSDGGTSWQASSFSVPGDASNIEESMFVSAKNGWLVLVGDGGTGASPKYLYRTTDGGVTFKLVNTSAFQLPHNGDTVMADVTPDGKHGIVAGVDPLSNTISIGTSADGGSHFSTQQLNMPASVHNVSQIRILQAQVVDSHSARVTAIVGSAAGQLLVVMNEDQHGVWHTVASKVTDDVQAVQWTSTDTGLAIERQGTKLVIRRTADGGQTWATDGTIPDNLVSGSSTVLKFQMIDMSTGWLLIQNGNLQPALLSTTDGGQHWSQA